MKLAPLILLLLVAACASRTAKDVPMTGVEPSCARQCLGQHSDCVGQSSRAFGAMNQARLVDACTDGLESCRNTCPAKP